MLGETEVVGGPEEKIDRFGVVNKDEYRLEVVEAASGSGMGRVLARGV